MAVRQKPYSFLSNLKLDEPRSRDKASIIFHLTVSSVISPVKLSVTRPFVTSEVAPLQQVVVHTPGEEMAAVSPDRLESLLFEDILFEDIAQREHILMCEVFRKIVGRPDAVVEFADLLLETFQIEEARHAFVDTLAEAVPARNYRAYANELKQLSPEELHRFALAGRSPLPVEAPPIPNVLFTRDLAATVCDHLILSNAATPARVREGVLVRIIVRYHPSFAGVSERTIELPAAATFEGGDLLVASDKVVLIGHSERTNYAGISAIAEALFARTTIEHVLMVDLPKQRSCMHLDTVFTFADERTCVVFPPYIQHERHNVVHLTPGSEPGVLQSRKLPSVQHALESLLDRTFTFIPCGGEDPHDQVREQWTDGSNVFAPAPGVVVGYERNRHTFAALQRHGYRVVSAKGFLDYHAHSTFAQDEKLAIKLVGTELSRGRGGPRCMTMPLRRSTVG